MTLPVAARELRVASQAIATYRSRTYMAAFGMIATGWALADMLVLSLQPAAFVGQMVFSVQAWTVFVLAAFGGYATTADSISHEKRDGTLGLLFLTHLKGRDIVLGKLVANTAKLFSGILALGPVIALPMLLGGIQLSQSARLLLSVLNTMFFSASVGLLASARSVNRQKSETAALTFLLFWIGGLPLIAQGLQRLHIYPELSWILQVMSPLFAQKLALGMLLGPQQSFFWMSILIVFLAGCGFMAAASWTAPRYWQEGARTKSGISAGSKMAAWWSETMGSRSEDGRSLLEKNAFAWLTLRLKRARTKLSVFIGMTVAITALLIWNFSRHNDPGTVRLIFCPLAVFLLQWRVKTGLGGAAQAAISEAKEAGTLDLIMVSRLTVRDMVRDQIKSIYSIFALPFAMVTVLSGAGLVLCHAGIARLAEVFTTPPDVQMFRTRALCLVLVSLFFLVLDALALTWTGIWAAFTAPTGVEARVRTFLSVLVTPYFLIGALVTILFQFASVRVPLGAFYPMMVVCIGVVVGIDLTLIFYCRNRILKLARRVMTTPAEISDYWLPRAWSERVRVRLAGKTDATQSA